MPRPTVAHIDLEALRHNYRLAQELAGSASAMAVIKADGYGHGIRAVARALADDVRCFAVACLEEALAVRDEGLEQTVVLLQGVHSEQDMVTCACLGFELVVHSDYQLDWVLNSTERVPVWVKVNSGMNRLGYRPSELPVVMGRLAEAGCVPKGFLTHFASADEFDSPATEGQTEAFRGGVAPWPELLLSVGNSAAHFRAGQPLFDWSRPGIMLYGASPMADRNATELGLKPVMTLESELIAVRTLQPGDSVGYGQTWTAERPVRMGIVAIGYGDGYPRHAGTDTPAWTNGNRIRLIGRVSMDMLAVDLTDAPSAQAGDKVELWGCHVPIDEVARHAGTIGYELLTGVTARVPRRYHD
ncbi:alanine racemase [Marinobacter zhejiangensis]|uniref:Alanine racemase n=1 Tax=Marinobacter zhejiangensis TaxID=488535 RepID=A0A1I4TG01_9GAMM|nr:alanine racemase [Marinobacter zhejiangensis]SFM75644.1 alanine racemase [Marinobacter zhejiangensis]